MHTSDIDAVRRAGIIGAIGGALTALSGLLVQGIILPRSDVSDQMWSYPWSSSALVTVSVLYAVFHALALVGLLGFARSGIAGEGRAARIGAALAIAGTALFLVAELTSIPVADQRLDDTSAGLVIALTFFVVANLLAAIGLLILGVTTVRAGRWDGWRRFTPLATGVVLTALLGLAATPALAGGVGVYGICVLAFGVALATQPAPSTSHSRTGAIQV